MKTGKIIKRAAVLLLALMLAAGTLSAAAAEAPAPMDVDLIMAKNAIAGFHIEDGNGHLMEPRRAEDMKGRGLPDEVGVEPDYGHRSVRQHVRSGDGGGLFHGNAVGAARV